MGIVLVLALIGIAYGVEPQNGCDPRYRRCIFDCVQRFPLDNTEREKCVARCELSRGVCKFKEGANSVMKGLRHFLKAL